MHQETTQGVWIGACFHLGVLKAPSSSQCLSGLAGVLASSGGAQPTCWTGLFEMPLILWGPITVNQPG